MTTGRPARRSSSAIWTPDAEHQHAAAGDLAGSPVAGGGQLVDLRVDSAGGRRHVGLVLGPCRHDHVAREPGSLVGDHAQAACGRLD
jgi:hypothetical protein